MKTHEGAGDGASTIANGLTDHKGMTESKLQNDHQGDQNNDRYFLFYHPETKKINDSTRSKNKSIKSVNNFEPFTSKSAHRLTFTRKTCWPRNDTEANWKSESLILITSTNNWFRKEFKKKEDTRKKKHNSGKGSCKKNNNKEDKSYKNANKEEDFNSKNVRKESDNRERSVNEKESKNWTNTSKSTENDWETCHRAGMDKLHE